MQKHNEGSSLVEAWLQHVVSEETRDWSTALRACRSSVVPNVVSVIWSWSNPTVCYYVVLSGADIDECALRLDMFIKAHQKLTGETL